jgi:hypothetical protein
MSESKEQLLGENLVRRALIIDAQDPTQLSSNQVPVFIRADLPDDGDHKNCWGARTKAARLLGVDNVATLDQQVAWLRRRSSDGLGSRQRQVSTKALQILGVTVEDLYVEKALLVLGEAPGVELRPTCSAWWVG